MELVSNLVWCAVSCLVFGTVDRALAARKLQVSRRAAFTAAALLCLVLLPVISMSDDLLESRQAALPLASQTWHLASEAASVGMELLSAICTYLLFLAAPLLLQVYVAPERAARQQSAWLMRSQRLRPPPAFAH